MKFTDRLRQLIQAAENGLSAPAEKALMEFLSDNAKEIVDLVGAAEKAVPMITGEYCSHEGEHGGKLCYADFLINALDALEGD